jgi:hypothetical protein
MKRKLFFMLGIVAIALSAGCQNDSKGGNAGKGIATALVPAGDSSNMPQPPPLKSPPAPPK